MHELSVAMNQVSLMRRVAQTPIGDPDDPDWDDDDSEDDEEEEEEDEEPIQVTSRRRGSGASSANEGVVFCGASSAIGRPA